MSSMVKRHDLLVVGGGVLGVFHALLASQRGLNVVLIERHGRPQGATVRNFGQVVPSGMNGYWQQFGRESLEIYRAIQQQFDISLRQLGSIYLASNQEECALLEELHQRNIANDYRSELWTARQCAVRYPQLRPEYCQGGLFFPEEASVDPRFMINRLHGFLAKQSRFRAEYGCWVKELSVAGEGVVAITTDGREFQAERAIVCSGAEFQMLYPELFRASDLQLVKLQMARLAAQPQASLPRNVLTGLTIRRYEAFAECPSWKAIKSREPQDAFWKKWGVHILFKQEVDGTIVLGDSHEYASVAESDCLGFDLREDVTRYFVEEGKKIFDLPSSEVASVWYGTYCQTDHPSGIFRQTVDQRIHIVTGIGGKGMTSSAGFAKHHLAEIYND